MERDSQISAVVSSTTRSLLEKHVRRTGIKKGHLVEQALLHYLQALDALPSDVIIPPVITVTRRSGEEILKRIANPRPTPRLRKLFKTYGS